MNYKETVNYLFNKLPIYQRKGVIAYKKDIGNITEICNQLGNPQNNFKSIHIAGTNGKGSTAHIIASILQEANYKVGLYTSPHLKDFRERIKINGEMISKKNVIKFVSINKKKFKEINMSFFEMTVAMAFDYFSKEEVDIAIIETGLGGRLDSTNIITPILSIITNISIDHSNLLGNTIEEIATEKAGIIKPSIPILIGRKQKETLNIFSNISKKNKSQLIYAKSKNTNHTSKLKGDYQIENTNTSISCAEILIKMGWKIKKYNIKDGIRNCIQNTGIQGRWQTLQKNPLIICDTAHNEEGIKKVMLQIKKIKYNCLHIVFGTVNDKELTNILTLLPKNAKYYFCKAKIPRALTAKLLQEKCKSFQLNGNSYRSVSSAVINAKRNSTKKDLIFIGGSTFVVAEVI